MSRDIGKLIPDSLKEAFEKLTDEEIAAIIIDHLKSEPIKLEKKEMIAEYEADCEPQYHQKIPEMKQNDSIYQAGPVAKGKFGEKYVYDILGKLNGDFSVKFRHKEKNKGDIWIKYKPIIEDQLRIYRIMLDVKNYSSNVPTRETDKFISDFETNDSDAGILLSLNTKITGHEGLGIRYVTKQAKRCPLIFVQCSDPDLILQYVYFISRLMTHRDYQKAYDDELEKLIDLSESISEVMQDMEDIRSTVDKQFRRSVKTLTTMKVNFEKSIKNLGKLKKSGS